MKTKTDRFAGKFWLKTGITLLVGAVCLYGYIWLRMATLETSWEVLTEGDRVRYISDAFFTVGALMASFGAIVLVSSEGVFDGIAYSVREMSWFFWSRYRGKNHETFASYKARKAEKGRTVLGHLFMIGALFLAVSGVLTLIFMRQYA